MPASAACEHRTTTSRNESDARLLSGKERTEKEFSEMLRTAAFRLDRVIDVGMSTSILESVAVQAHRR
jgi:hypothetical protein